MSGDWIVTDLDTGNLGRNSELENSHDGGFLQEIPRNKNQYDNETQSFLVNDTKARWLSGAWPISPFKEGLKINERKAEWIRFREQFLDILACKGEVDPMIKLTGLKIYGGPYLSNIIKIELGKIPEPEVDIFAKILNVLDLYFNKICDTGKERIKFREMRMNEQEPFEDWILRLETQATFCEFDESVYKEEFLLAILRRSIPGIADKLYEMSEIFNKDIEAIKKHGQHLDFIRRELMTSTNDVNSKEAVAKSMSMEPENAINAVQHDRGRKFINYRRRGNFRGVYKAPSHSRRIEKNCGKCGSTHERNRCKAFGLKCFKCKQVGHFAHLCRNGYVKPSKEDEDSKKDVRKEIGKINQVLYSDSE